MSPFFVVLSTFSPPDITTSNKSLDRRYPHEVQGQTPWKEVCRCHGSLVSWVLQDSTRPFLMTSTAKIPIKINFKFHYIKGKLNVVSDTLSRYHNEDVPEDSDPQFRYVESSQTNQRLDRNISLLCTPPVSRRVGNPSCFLNNAYLDEGYSH